MFVLGIETSCDDTSVALVDCSAQGSFVIAERTASQIDLHKIYGGVVPELAGRLHAEAITPLIETVLNETREKLGKEKSAHAPELISVTAGPGLVTGLIVGLEAARALSYAWNIPVVATNHIDGHLHSVEISKQKNEEAQKILFPALALVVSGGHTELVLLKDHTDYAIIGRTHDDAAGECFDKVAKLLELPYPGGPKISQLAETGRTDAISFPRPMLHEKNYDFSFAGLKTSALYWLRDNSLTKDLTMNDFCASFEQAIIDVLVGKTLRAAEDYRPKSVLLVGGVSANKALRHTLEEKINQAFPETSCLLSSPGYSMDNGAMIAVAGYHRFQKHGAGPWHDLDVDPNWRVDKPFAKQSR